MGFEDPLKRAEHRLDGRNVDPSIGVLSGEGAAQRAREPNAEPFVRSPEAEDAELGPTYYGLSPLKEPVWNWMIPAYFFTGGLAGACAVLGSAAQIAAPDRTRVLVRRSRVLAFGAAGVSAVLLIADLGRPARFLNMMRVFRPTSPMNMGTWLLAGFGALSAASIAPELALLAAPRALGARRLVTTRTGRRLLGARAARRAGVDVRIAPLAEAAALGAGALGLPLVGYTGVLLANTAVPLWQQTRNALPVLFAFSGAVSAGAVFDLWPVPEPAATMARRFSLLAKGAELMTSFGLDGEARRVPRVARPLTHGRSGALVRAARLLLLGSAVLDVLAGARRRRRAVGLLALAGTIALRFGIVSAGRASARDPHATFEMQRSGRGARELARGERAPAHMPTLPGVHPTGKESYEHGAAP